MTAKKKKSTDDEACSTAQHYTLTDFGNVAALITRNPTTNHLCHTNTEQNISNISLAELCSQEKRKQTPREQKPQLWARAT